MNTCFSNVDITFKFMLISSEARFVTILIIMLVLTAVVNVDELR